MHETWVTIIQVGLMKTSIFPSANTIYRNKNKTLITHPSLSKEEDISKRVKEYLHISHITYSYFAIFLIEKVNVT